MRISIRSVALVPVLACSVSVPPLPAPAESAAPDAPPPPTEEGAPAVPTQPAPAQEGLRAKIDAIIEPEIDPSGANAKIVGAAVAILTPSVRTVLGYGVTGFSEKTVPASSTIFEIGSNTKPITGLVLAQQIVNGATSLDAQVTALLPAGVDVPSYQGAPIRLVHLATHTSGLPDFPDNLVGKPPTPAAGYTDAMLYDFLGGHALSAAPGAAMAYSNLGFGLLGVALKEAEGAPSYEALFRAHLGDRLGMKDTWVNVPASSIARLAHGSRRGKAMPPVKIDTLEGSGGLRSTAADMLAFMAANVSPPSELKAAVRLSQKVHAEIGGKKMALGLSVDTTADGYTRYAKGGGTPGFTSHVCFTTSPPAAVVVLTNTAGADAVKGMTERALEEVIASMKQP